MYRVKVWEGVMYGWSTVAVVQSKGAARFIAAKILAKGGIAIVV